MSKYRKCRRQGSPLLFPFTLSKMAKSWQNRTKTWVIAALLLATIIIAIVAIRYFLNPSVKRGRDATQPVKTAVSGQQTVPVILRANGYVTAIKTVEVRPQIQNVVRAIHVKEGQDVKAGQLLFTLDARSEVANVDKARAQLSRDKADLADAEATLRRNQELLAKKFISQAVVDTSKARVDALRGTTRADQASLEASHVTLGYNRIHASISGRIGVINVHPGSLVQPTGTTMVTIAQLDPIHVSFTVPEAELAHITASYPNGNAPVTIQLPSKETLEGKLVFIDNTTDPQSGTIKMKAEFPNREQKLWPGAFVNVQLVSRTLENATVVPVQAVVTGPKEQFIYVVQPDSSVKAQKVVMLTTEGGIAAVSGLQPNVRVVVEGAQNLRPGTKVREAGAGAATSAPAVKKKDASSVPPPSQGGG